jgi:anti-sigma factor RsiW
MMDHQEIRELLPAYVDQELGISDTLAVERHLGSCIDCQRDYAEQRAVRSRLKEEAMYFHAPAHLAQRIDAALPQDKLPAARSRPWMINWLNAGVAMATLLMTVWSTGLWLKLPSEQERLTEEVVASHVRALQVDHLADVASSDRHTVKPWFNGKLNFSPPVADLALQAFPLVGGRLDYLDGQPVAALIYRHNQHAINLYIWPSTAKDAGPDVQVRQGFHLMHWTSRGMAYWAISDLAASDLSNFVDLLRAAVLQ